MKIDFEDGLWWGLIKNGVLYSVIKYRIKPSIFDFQTSFSTENEYEIIPITIREEK